MSDYLIWSNEHVAWWGPDRCGYVERIEQAGRYSRAEALEISTAAIPGRFGTAHPLPELPVLLEDVAFMLERFAGEYSRDPEAGLR